jgi:hypothetical protein
LWEQTPVKLPPKKPLVKANKMGTADVVHEMNVKVDAIIQGMKP